MKKIKLAIINILYLSVPAFVSAENTGVTDRGANTGVTDGGVVGIHLQNPLATTTITEFLQEILAVIMIFAVPLIIFMIIYAGFMYVTAQGNESKVSKAHKALLYAVIGGLLILGANIILAVIQGTVDAFR